MFLEKPAFPVSFTASEAEEKVSNLLRQREWPNPIFDSVQLVFVPYWFYHFDVREKQKSKIKLVSSGFGSMNAFSNELDDHAAKIAEREDLEKKNEVPDHFEFNMRKPKVSKEEAKELIAARLSDKMSVHVENIFLSGLEIAYIPYWVINMTIAEKPLSITVNASTKEFVNAHLVPVREKNFNELLQEVMSDLSNPAEWLNYSADVLGSVSKSIASGPQKTKSGSWNLNDYDFQLLALGVIAIIVIIWVAYL